MKNHPAISETMIEAGLKAYADWHVLDGTRKLVINIIEAALASRVFPQATSEKK